MFDRYEIHKGEAVPYEKTVTHKLAPTAEHMRLLDEFREQARASIIENIPVEGNVTGRIVRFDGDLGAEVAFEVNGKRYNGRIDHWTTLEGPQRAFEIIRHTIAEAMIPQAVPFLFPESKRAAPPPGARNETT